MKWFYAHLGDTDNRGVVEQEELFKMARKGNLAPSDLVWNQEKDDGWVPASTVPGLFTETPEQETTSAEKDQEDATATEPKPAKSGNFIPILLILLIFLAATVAYTMKKEADIKNANHIKEEIEVNAPDSGIIRSNKIEELVNQIDTALTGSKPGKASSTLTKLIEYDYENENITMFSNRIDTLNADLSKINTLWQSLYAGKLTSESAKTLIKLYNGRGGNPMVLGHCQKIMTNKKIENSTASLLSLARIFKALESQENEKNMLDKFLKKANYKGSEDIYIEASRMLAAQGRINLTIHILEKYLENQPNNSVAWLEFAAVQASGDTPKDAFDSLKKAIKHGDNNTKKTAIKDARFESIKDKRTFRKLTK